MRRFKQQVALTVLFFITSLQVHVLALNEGQVSFSTQERQFLNNLQQIRLCTARDSLPLDEIQDDKHIGINADYMELFEKRLGIPITLLPTKSWDESLAAIKIGKCDIIALAARTPQREEYLLFSDSYVSIPFVVVTTQEKFFVSKMEDMISRDLGVNRGYAYNDLVRNRWPDVNLVEVETIQEGLDLVAAGEIFGYMSGLNMAGYAIQTGGYTNLKINGQFDELEMIELGIGIRKQLPLLKPIFDKAIGSINPETKKRIDSSWLTVRYDIVEDYQTIIQIAVGAGIILLFLAYRQFHLRQHNIQLAEREKAIWHQANYDFLTGLPNRRLFQDRLSHKIDRVIRTHKSFALLLIDLDGFKEVNDTLGHDQGDQMLIEASDRIQNCLRKSDTIARLGGDEFVVLLNDIENRGSVETVAQKILDTLMRPFNLKDTAFISASIGITLCPKDSLEMVELLKNADQAMYAAKENGRNKFNYFTPEMQQSAMTRMLLVKELRLAIQEEQFEVFYQPIIDLQQNRIYKAEALIRWRHPERGLVSPIQFIPVLEDTGLITEVGEWIFIQAARQANKLRQTFDPDFQISVNASPVQFHNQSVIDWIDLLSGMSISPHVVAIEITENTLMETTRVVAEHLLRLRDNGFQVSLDDFGTGYSSLAYLKKFDIDFIKIDQSFVRNLSTHSNDLALCEAIIVMSHKLGLKVIAEGVENEEQMHLLSEAGCDYGQGYFFSKPVDSETFEQFLLDFDAHNNPKDKVMQS